MVVPQKPSPNPANRPRPRRAGLIREYLYFLRHYRMWWLTPIFTLVLLLGFLLVIGGSKAALLIYALF